MEMLDIELTPERVIKMGETFGTAWLNTLPLEKRLAGLQPEERLAGLEPEERLAGLTPEEIKEIERYLEKMRQENGTDL